MSPVRVAFDALEPGLVLAPPDVPAAGHIEAVLVKDRHAEKVAGAFAAVGVVFVNVGFGGPGVKVELEYPPQGLERRGVGLPGGFLRGRRVWDGVEGRDDAVAGGEKDEGTGVDLAGGRGGRGGVKDVGGDGAVIAGDGRLEGTTSRAVHPARILATTALATTWPSL